MNKIIFVQPALPRYRMDFFERLSKHYDTRMKVYYSPGSLGALTRPATADWAVAVEPMRRLPGGIGWQPGIIGLRPEQGDIVVLSGNPRQISTLILLVRAKLSGARVIWWGHYWSSTSRRWRQVLRFLPMALADALLFYTDDEVADYAADSARPFKGLLTAALNNGLDLDVIKNHRSPYLSTERVRALLFIGRLTEKSELGLGLDALALLGAEAPILHVIGDGEGYRDLLVRAEKLGISDKVVWHGAVTEEEIIAAIANKCQAFIYPGQVGLSLIHAMAYGLPAIVHAERRRHMPEIAAFRDGVTGVSFLRGDAAALAGAIYTLLSDSAELARLAAGTATVVGPSFSTEDMARRFVALVNLLEAGA